jgi:hypothetical protein
VQTTAVGNGTYTVSALSKSGTAFTISKAADGTITRGCSVPNKGGCKAGGTW